MESLLGRRSRAVAARVALGVLAHVGDVAADLKTNAHDTTVTPRLVSNEDRLVVGSLLTIDRLITIDISHTVNDCSVPSRDAGWQFCTWLRY